MRLITTRLAKLSPKLKEVRLHLCQFDEASKGARDFVEKLYGPLKKENPELPILIRECEGIQPRLWGRFALGKETSISVTNKSAEEIKSQIEELGK